jgi:hypothetical protein
VKRYRRIEITAFRRLVTVTSGEIVLNNLGNQPARTEEGVQLRNAESGEAIEFESAEGQLILVDAVRSLERRLSPEVRARLYRRSKPHPARRPGRIRVYSKLRALMHSAIHPQPPCLHRKEK